MRPVPTLAALALAGLALPAHALTIEDKTLSVGVKLQIQTRAQLLNDAEGATGGDYDPLRGTAGEAEAARFYLRRARLGFGVSWGDWRGMLMVRGGEVADLETGGDGRNVSLFYANGARVLAAGQFTHDLHFGLDKPYNAESSLGSTAYALPTERLTSQLIAARAVGVGYGLRSPFVNAGIDVMNNSTAAKDTDAADERNGYFYSARIEIMPGAAYNPGKRQESYLGKTGTHAVLGVDVQVDDGNLTGVAGGGWTRTDTLTWGPDLIVHWDAVTALAELRLRTTSTETNAGVENDVDGRWLVLQAAYAFPLANSQVIEPVVRFTLADANVDADTASTYSTAGGSTIRADNGGDGTTVDVGLSWYISGHGNKLQLAYQRWLAEEGDGAASIVRLQHQLAF